MNDNKKPLTPFRFWCQKVIPLVYDDSLSYYELLCKVIEHLNEVIEATNGLLGGVDAFTDSVEKRVRELMAEYNTEVTTKLEQNLEIVNREVSSIRTELTQVDNRVSELRTYVDNYFSSVDISVEIGNKLDQMAASGELDEIIKPVIGQYISDLTTRVDTIEKEVNGLSPRVGVLETQVKELLARPIPPIFDESEIIDMRTGFNNKVYKKAGDAIRGSDTELSNALSDKTNKAILVYTGKQAKIGATGKIEFVTNSAYNVFELHPVPSTKIFTTGYHNLFFHNIKGNGWHETIAPTNGGFIAKFNSTTLVPEDCDLIYFNVLAEIDNFTARDFKTLVHKNNNKTGYNISLDGLSSSENELLLSYNKDKLKRQNTFSFNEYDRNIAIKGVEINPDINGTPYLINSNMEVSQPIPLDLVELDPGTFEPMYIFINIYQAFWSKSPSTKPLIRFLGENGEIISVAGKDYSGITRVNKKLFKIEVPTTGKIPAYYQVQTDSVYSNNLFVCASPTITSYIENYSPETGYFDRKKDFVNMVGDFSLEELKHGVGTVFPCLLWIKLDTTKSSNFCFSDKTSTTGYSLLLIDATQQQMFYYTNVNTSSLADPPGELKKTIPIKEGSTLYLKAVHNNKDFDRTKGYIKIVSYDVKVRGSEEVVLTINTTNSNFGFALKPGLKKHPWPICKSIVGYVEKEDIIISNLPYTDDYNMVKNIDMSTWQNSNLNQNLIVKIINDGTDFLCYLNMGNRNTDLDIRAIKARFPNIKLSTSNILNGVANCSLIGEAEINESTNKELNILLTYLTTDKKIIIP